MSRNMKSPRVLMALVTSLAITAAPQAAAQRDSVLLSPRDSWRPHLFYGGSIYLSFGNGTSIGASPMVGWQFTPQFGTGVGVTYIYYARDDFESNVYGGRLMARYDVVPAAYVKGEFAYLWYNDSSKDVDLGTTEVPYLFLGGGYRQRVSRNTYLEFEIMFDVLQDPDSHYDTWEPVFGVGVSVGV
jgi:hypothetical protein